MTVQMLPAYLLAGSLLLLPLACCYSDRPWFSKKKDSTR